MHPIVVHVEHPIAVRYRIVTPIGDAIEVAFLPVFCRIRIVLILQRGSTTFRR
jgi:hypothetical protein